MREIAGYAILRDDRVLAFDTVDEMRGWVDSHDEWKEVLWSHPKWEEWKAKQNQPAADAGPADAAKKCRLDFCHEPAMSNDAEYCEEHHRRAMEILTGRPTEVQEPNS